MPTLFRTSQRRFALVPVSAARSPGVDRGARATMPLAPARAALYLRGSAARPGVMPVLRQALAESGRARGLQVWRLADHEVVDELVRRVAQGRLRLVEIAERKLVLAERDEAPAAEVPFLAPPPPEVDEREVIPELLVSVELEAWPALRVGLAPEDATLRTSADSEHAALTTAARGEGPVPLASDAQGDNLIFAAHAESRAPTTT